jgi:hypothetical protein
VSVAGLIRAIIPVSLIVVVGLQVSSPPVGAQAIPVQVVRANGGVYYFVEGSNAWRFFPAPFIAATLNGVAVGPKLNGVIPPEILDAENLAVGVIADSAMYVLQPVSKKAYPIEPIVMDDDAVAALTPRSDDLVKQGAILTSAQTANAPVASLRDASCKIPPYTGFQFPLGAPCVVLTIGQPFVSDVTNTSPSTFNGDHYVTFPGDFYAIDLAAGATYQISTSSTNYYGGDQNRSALFLLSVVGPLTFEGDATDFSKPSPRPLGLSVIDDQKRGSYCGPPTTSLVPQVLNANRCQFTAQDNARFYIEVDGTYELNRFPRYTLSINQVS